MSEARSLVLTPAANADIEEHRDWCRLERADRPDLLIRFEVALVRALNAIERNPEAFAADRTGTRHARLADVSYAAFFKIDVAAVVVFAVLQDRQDPATWRSRV